MLEGHTANITLESCVCVRVWEREDNAGTGTTSKAITHDWERKLIPVLMAKTGLLSPKARGKHERFFQDLHKANQPCCGWTPASNSYKARSHTAGQRKTCRHNPLAVRTGTLQRTSPSSLLPCSAILRLQGTGRKQVRPAVPTEWTAWERARKQDFNLQRLLLLCLAGTRKGVAF